MNQKQKHRLFGIFSIIIIVSLAISLILYALKQNINLFYTPTELLQSTIQPHQHIRIGGYVKNHSVHYDTLGQGVSFIITDRHHEIHIQYHGVLPNLFREGQGVVVTGQLNAQTVFLADEVLAKHDEKYMPQSLAKELTAGDNRGT